MPDKKPVSKANQRAVAKYMKNNYDDIKVRVKKGNRQIITDIATEQDKSLNSYIKAAISEKVKSDTGNDIDL